MRAWVYVLALFSMAPMAQAHVKTVKLGDTAVRIRWENRGAGSNFIHLHLNEKTALRAAKQVLSTCGGRLIYLEHNGARNISFRLNKKKYVFDPNRIFTDHGIQATLKKLSQYDDEAAMAVKKLSDEILSLIPAQGKIIAVHNNKHYSMKYYEKNGPLAGDAKAINKNPKRYYRNFYFVTTQDQFDRYQKSGHNVVLQNNQNAKDDGSLSIALSGRDYVNVEAGHDQFQQQLEMLKTACFNQ